MTRPGLLDLTLTDLFCGAGGSSTGAIAVPGVTVRVAANHWDLAIRTHNTNHQNTDHICADISQINPRMFPRTLFLWVSPECTNHSRAKGQKKDTAQQELWSETLPDAAAERSRATMWDVVRFAEHHQYEAVIVENVVEVADWLPFRGWLLAMDALGYRVQVVSMNSMHAQAFGDPAPQSRDRVYFVFTKKTNPAPDLDMIERPSAYCGQCDRMVRPIKAWKKLDRDPMRPGRYKSQYVFRCPSVSCRNQVVEPGWLPADTIINWSLPGQRIGDRKKPLKPNTRTRIAAGIARYWSPFHLEAQGNTYDAASPKHPRHGDPNSYYRAWSVGEPLRTLHTIESKALAVPVEGRAAVDRCSSMSAPLRTQNTRLETALAAPPGAFVAHLKGTSAAQLRGAHSPITDPMHTIAASGNHHALITSYYGKSTPRPVDQPLGTVTTVDKHALVTPCGGTWNDTAYDPARQPLRTVTTRDTSAVITPGDIAAAEAQVDDVLFRMLEPSECKRAMAFPDEYQMLGTRREQVRMAGNAVTPSSARDLIWCVARSLGAPV